jgi:transcriptional regulator with XRE-family HTH domain
VYVDTRHCAGVKEMASEETVKLIADLKAWADQQYGRRAELARTLGVSRQVVSDWLGGRSVPTLEKGLKLMAFLKSHKASKMKQPVE